MSFFLASISSINGYPVIVKLIIAFIAGLVPVLLWLWFWEHEDKHPEPRRLVLLAFIAGGISVIFALFFEQAACTYLTDPRVGCSPVPPAYIFIIWAIIEELLKFAAAYITVLSRMENDEPIDSIMYMITTALGFAALENTLFLFNLMYNNQALDALMAGNVRFIGATLLHTISSGIIGLALAFSFYKKKRLKRWYVFWGVVGAITLHVFFNLSIITFKGSLFIVPFYGVWIAVIFILLAFERVKQLKR